MKQSLGVIFVALFNLTFAQQELTLDDAVMQQYRKFYPERITGFNWIPNTTKYAYLSGDRATLYTSNPSTKKEEVLLNKKELNEILGTDLWGFYPIEFTSENIFIMNDGASFYEVNIKERTGKTLLCHKEATPFAFAGPDQFKYDTSIDIFTAYKRYIASKPWVVDNYLRDPSRKPNWL